VVIEEHQAMARWSTVALVNKHGELFHAASGSDLPVFYGPNDGVIEVASQYDSFNNILKNVGLEIASLALTPRRAWQITTGSGMVIELGRVDMQTRLEKFANVYASTLAGLNKKIVYADLRYPNGFALRRPTESLKVAQVQDTAGNDKVLLKELEKKQLTDKPLNQTNRAVENRDLKLRRG